MLIEFIEVGGLEPVSRQGQEVSGKGRGSNTESMFGLLFLGHHPPRALQLKALAGGAPGQAEGPESCKVSHGGICTTQERWDPRVLLSPLVLEQG